MKKHNSKQAWFKYIRGSYLPCSLAGLTIYLTYAVYMVSLSIVWYYEGHKLWSLLVSVIPLSVVAMLIVQYVASKHSR